MVNRLWPLLMLDVRAGRARRSSCRRSAAIAAGLRDHLGARVAAPGGGGGGDRGARRRALLRRHDVAAERRSSSSARRASAARTWRSRDGPTSCSSRWAARRGCARRTRSWRRRCERAGAAVVVAAARAAAGVADVRRRSSSPGRSPRARGRERGDRGAPPAGDRVLLDHRGACWPRGRARSASTPRPPATARAATGSGSARSSAAACATRRCSCRGARAGWRRRRARTRTRSSCRCRSSPPAPAAERDIAAITYGANPEKKGLDRVLAAWEAARHEGEELSSPASMTGGDGPRGGALRAGCSPARRATGRCCGGRGCSSRPAAGGLRDRAARGAGRRVPARHDPLAGAVRGAAAGAGARPAARRRDRARAIRTALDDPRDGYAERASELLAPWRPRGGRRGGARAAAAAVSLAGMTPISGQSVLITGAAHGIGAETARRLAARGARVSLVGLGDLEAVAADCPGSITFEADVTDRDALDAAVSGTVEAFGGIDTLFANAGIGAPGFVRSMDPEMFERVDRGQPDRRVAHDPRLPAARDRAPRLRPPGRVDGRDPAAGRARRLRGGEVGRREPRPRAARGDRSTTASTSASPTSRGSTPRWSAAPTAPSSARACAPCSPARWPSTYPVSAAAEAVVRGIERRQRIVAVPRWLIGLMWLKPILPRLTERELRNDIARFDALAEREARERGNEPVGAGGEAERAARRVPSSSPASAAARTPPTGACWHLLRRQPGAPGGRDRRSAAARSSSRECASESISTQHAGLGRRAGVDSFMSRRSGRRVDLDHRARARGRLDHALDVERVGRAGLDLAAGRVADRVDQRVLDRARSCGRSSPPRSIPNEVWTEAITQSRLREQLVGVVERAVGEDVDLGAGQHRRSRRAAR